MSFKPSSIGNLQPYRYLIYFSYIGTKYYGIQRVANREEYLRDNSIQGCIESAIIEKLRPLYGARISVSSRTDSGVHALLNTAHFDLVHPDAQLIYHPHQITAAINEYMRRNEDEINVMKTRLIPRHFHCRREAKWRSYIYRLAIVNDNSSLSHSLNGPFWGLHLESLLPITELNRCYITRKPDFEKIQRTKDLFLGEHDFSNFMKHKFNAKREEFIMNPVKNIEQFDFSECDFICQPSDKISLFQFHIKSKSFLHNQIRRMIGCILSVASGRITESYVKNLLDNPQEYKWNKNIFVVPAYGLWLKHIEYDENDLEFRDEEYEYDYCDNIHMKTNYDNDESEDITESYEQ